MTEPPGVRWWRNPDLGCLALVGGGCLFLAAFGAAMAWLIARSAEWLDPRAFVALVGAIVAWIVVALLLRRVDATKAARAERAERAARQDVCRAMLTGDDPAAVVVELHVPSHSSGFPDVVCQIGAALDDDLCPFTLRATLWRGGRPRGRVEQCGSQHVADSEAARAFSRTRSLSTGEAAVFLRTVELDEPDTRATAYWCAPALTIWRDPSTPAVDVPSVHAFLGSVDRRHFRLIALLSRAVRRPIGPIVTVSPPHGLLPLRLGDTLDELSAAMGPHWKLSSRRVGRGATLLSWRGSGVRALLDEPGNCTELAALTPSLSLDGLRGEDRVDLHIESPQRVWAQRWGAPVDVGAGVIEFPTGGVTVRELPTPDTEEPDATGWIEYIYAFDVAVWDTNSHARSLLLRPPPGERSRSVDEVQGE